MAETKPPTAATIRSKPFPEALYNLLKFVESNDHEHIISWVNDGRALQVHLKEEFENELLPRYFNTTKYNSFTRALYAHGFTCQKKGSRTGIYSHPSFNRQNMWAPWLIKRAKSKRNAKGAASRSDTSDSLSDSALSGRLPKLRPRISESMLDTGTRSNTSGQMPVAGQQHQVICSQVSHRASKTPLHLPQLAGQLDSDNDSARMEPQAPSPSLNPSRNQEDDGKSAIAAPTISSCIPLSSKTITTDQDQDRKNQLARSYGALLDDHISPIPFSLDAQDLVTPNSAIDFYPCDKVLAFSLEPRSIQEMSQRPNNLCECDHLSSIG
ncbi:unnamed protein product [Cylindrotheca closterium]|uniref:HSF-type DNA-binding domain-containing protein n=1 Tax=Cylindrotheca closterium TaxID=2856 RepID=A0AAD2CNY1_9STRA|nr:unnamed protein product [Cylindrotheca closterium]